MSIFLIFSANYILNKLLKDHNAVYVLLLIINTSIQYITLKNKLIILRKNVLNYKIIKLYQLIIMMSQQLILILIFVIYNNIVLNIDKITKYLIQIMKIDLLLMNHRNIKNNYNNSKKKNHLIIYVILLIM